MELLLRYKDTKKTIDKISFTDAAIYFTGTGKGFGVERMDFSRGSRKSVQQTRGTISGDNVTDNFYVDTWWTSPPKIVLAGVVEIPSGMEKANAVGMTNGSSTNNESFIGTLEDMFKKNNHPTYVKNTEVLFADYIKKDYYMVTLINFNSSASVDRPNLLTFSLEMEVLEEGIQRG